MMRCTGGSLDELPRPIWRTGGLIACTALLLTAAACVPGDGPQPPNRTLLRGWTGGPPSSGTASNPAAAAGSGAGMPAPGTAGSAPLPAGSGGVTSGVGVPPAGRGGAGTVATAGTGGVTPLPEGGMPEFDGGSEPTRNMVRAGQICRRFTTLQCAGEAHCCTNPRRTFEQCSSEMLNDCMKNAYFDAIAENQISGFSEAHAATAFAKLEELAATCDPSVGVWTLQADGFRGIYQGTVAPNQQCRPMGFASQVNYGAALASCSQITTHACLFTGNGPIAAPESATCAPRGDAGATCFVATNCKDGLYCANPQGKYSTGKCTVGKAVGAACSNGEECATQTCVSGACAEPTAQTAWCLKP